MEINDTVRAELEAKHGAGKLLYLEHEGVQVACKRISGPRYQMFKSEFANEAKRAGALERVFHACLVHPDAAAMAAVLEDMPALADAFGEQILEAAGAGKAKRL